MDASDLDLNLLVALDALLREGSVGRAGARLGLSQPAMSHALKRLRAALDDPLLVRSGALMELTPRAEALRPAVAEILAQVRGLLVAKAFEPATAERRFQLMVPDHVFDLILPPLVSRLRTEAPGVRLNVRPWKGPVDMTRETAGAVDLVIACSSDDFPGFHRERLYADTDGVAVRRDHPRVHALAELDGFLSLGHVAVVGYGQHEDLVDVWLAENGLARRIEVVAPSYLQALHMVARTDLVAVVPRRQIQALAPALGLLVAAPPLDPGTFDEFMFHPTRLQTDPGAIWLRELVRDIVASLPD